MKDLQISVVRTLQMFALGSMLLRFYALAIKECGAPTWVNLLALIPVVAAIYVCYAIQLREDKIAHKRHRSLIDCYYTLLHLSNLKGGLYDSTKLRIWLDIWNVTPRRLAAAREALEIDKNDQA